jgi:hypothetical protein
MKPPRFTIASLMILVAVIALLIYMVFVAPSWLFFGHLPVLAATIGTCYRKWKLKGCRPRPSECIMVGLAGLAMLMPLIGMRLALNLGPAVSVRDRVSAFLVLLAIGVIPLVVFLLAGVLVRAEGQSPESGRMAHRESKV